VLDDNDDELEKAERLKMFEAGLNMERQQNEDRRREDSERFWRRVGIAGLVVLAATVTQFPWGSPYEGEPLSLALLMGLLLQLFLAFAGIVYGVYLAYRSGKWAYAKLSQR
jgi:Na+/H+ antiporter NhaD/arsenite permease-like protein